MARRLRAGLVNAAVVVASLAVSYLVIQFVFFRFLLADLPPNLRPYLSDRARIFAQTSSAHAVPQDYVALLGDSYAEGVGDWMLAAGGERRRPFGSADVIHALSGRDVASFGRAGAGSAEAMVLRVTRILGGGACYAFPPVETPKRFIVYFYEGNDLDDNNALIERDIQARGPSLAAATDAFLARDYGVESHWQCYDHLREMVVRMGSFVIRQHLRRESFVDLPASRNRVLIAGMPTAAPELQLPSMALGDQEVTDGITVFDRSLAWLRRNYPAAPATVIYIPSPGATYRHASAEVAGRDIYEPELSRKSGRAVLVDGRTFPVSGIYARSQCICEGIRSAARNNGAGFVDTRPALRAAGARASVHGPRDWKHVNETGYRLIGALVAKHLDDRPADTCDDRWPDMSADKAK
jgi:hypothetical protein